jgi:hypothetical protein
VFRFDAEKTRRLERVVETIELDAAQTQLMRDLAATVGARIGLDTIPCHGLWLRAVRAWQISHGKPATAITKMNPTERVQAATQIRDLFVEVASELLRAPDQQAALGAAVREAFDLYMKKYNKRPG